MWWGSMGRGAKKFLPKLKNECYLSQRRVLLNRRKKFSTSKKFQGSFVLFDIVTTLGRRKFKKQ